MKQGFMSLLRRCEYDALMQADPIDGKILDLGGDRRSGYHELLKGDHTITVVNINDAVGLDMQFDIEKPFPLEDDMFDGIICMNVLEHIFNFQNVLNEGQRVLKPGGRFIGVTPFMFNVHASPDDYFRYTGSAIKRMFEKAGFSEVMVKELGTGVFSTGFQLNFGLYRPDAIKWIAMKWRLFLDRVVIKGFLNRVRPGNHLDAAHVPLGYYFVAVK